MDCSRVSSPFPGIPLRTEQRLSECRRAGFFPVTAFLLCYVKGYTKFPRLSRGAKEKISFFCSLMRLYQKRWGVRQILLWRYTASRPKNRGARKKPADLTGFQKNKQLTSGVFVI
jgi:hypothetical protein